MYEVDQHREWLLSHVELPPGGTLVDLGCGRGWDLEALAAGHADPSATLFGIDPSAAALEEARARIADPRVRLIHGKAGPSLGLADSSLDVLMTQEVLECIPSVEDFVPELARVLKPGGQIIASHYDWDTQVFSGSDRGRTRRVVAAWADHEMSWMDHVDPWMGRKLWGLLEGSGLFEGSIYGRVMTNTVFEEPWHGFRMAQACAGAARKAGLPASDYQGFLDDLASLATEGRYFWSVNRYVYAGRVRP